MTETLLVQYTRGPEVESFHRVHALWVDTQGKSVQSWGDEDRLICPRSALKPLQALPLVLSRGFENSPHAMKALAIAAASHLAEDMHVDFVADWLKVLQKTPDDLICGAQKPDNFDRAKVLIERGTKIDKTFNNCSGKHTGMIAACLALGLESKNYYDWDHPYQERSRRIFSDLTGIDWDKAPYGIDGCGLPNYHVPLSAFAKGLANFLRPEATPYSDAMQLIHKAWTDEPYMTAGHGDIGSELSVVTNGRIMAKIGAQGNYMALDYRQGRCLVLKVEDGAAKAAEQALLTLLHEGSSISDEEEAILRKFVPREIRNWSGTVVGEARVPGF